MRERFAAVFSPSLFPAGLLLLDGNTRPATSTDAGRISAVYLKSREVRAEIKYASSSVTFSKF
jgi:hypothetical protein